MKTTLAVGKMLHMFHTAERPVCRWAEHLARVNGRSTIHMADVKFAAMCAGPQSLPCAIETGECAQGDCPWYGEWWGECALSNA